MNMKRLKSAHRRALGAAAVTTSLLVPLGVFGAPALARSGDASAQYQYKITICHHTHSKKHPMHTISVSVSSWPAHMKHGDTMGACPATAPTTSTSTHGKSGEPHGNSGNNGNGKGHGK